MTLRRAFTLIEMLVVLAIISLLISLLLPALRAGRDEAIAVKCAANTRSYATAFHAYAADNDGELPVFADKYPGLAVETLWYNTSAGYLGLYPLLPGDPQAGLKNSLNWNAPVRTCPAGGAFVGVHYGAWNDTKPPRAPINYRINAAGATPFTYPDLRIEDIRHPDSFMLNFDTSGHFMYSPNGWLRSVDTDSDGVSDTHIVLATNTSYIYNGARPRQHRDSTNAGFCDTHVERMSYAVWLDDRNGFWTDE